MIAVLYVNGLSPALFNQLKYRHLLSLLKGEEGCEEKHLQHLPGDFLRSRSERVRLIRTATHAVCPAHIASRFRPQPPPVAAFCSSPLSTPQLLVWHVELSHRLLRMPHKHRIHLASLRHPSLVNIPISLYGTIVERGVVRFPLAPIFRCTTRS